MRSRLWKLVLRDMPFPLRWLGTELVRFAQWIDQVATRFVLGLRDNPAWYFVATIGTVAVMLTFLMFVSLIGETSGQKVATPTRRAAVNLSRHDLERNHDWAVQDRWRIAHLFVLDKPSPRPRDLPLDSRVLPVPPVAQQKSSNKSTFAHQNKPQARLGQYAADPEVRLELTRPRKAQQEHRLVAGTVLDPSPEIATHTQKNRIRPRDSRLLVQASWEFGADCSPVVYTPRQPRRPILVPIPEPEPEPEVPRPITRRELPELSFELDLIRHFSAAGQFPPGAQLVSHTNHSSFPDLAHRFPSELVSHKASPWKQFHPGHEHTPENVTPYLGVGIYDGSHDGEYALDEFNPALHSMSEISFRLKLDTPEMVSAGHPHQTRLLISNEGDDPVTRIEVRDHLADLQTVVGADPGGTRDSETDPQTGRKNPMLHREVLNLIPGESQQLDLKWIPIGHSRQFHRTDVIAHTEISTSTMVTPPDSAQQMPSIPPERLERSPSFACDIQHLDRVTVGKKVELEIMVRNTGNTTLHGVKVKVDVPGNLSHRDGATIVFDAGNLPVEGRNRTVINLIAKEAGPAISHIRADAEEGVEVHGRMSIQIVEARKEKPSVPLPRPAPKAIRNNSKPAPNPTPTKARPPEECCCQKVTAPSDRIGD